MLSNKTIKKIIGELKNITKREIGVLERDGRIIANTEEDLIGITMEDVSYFVLSKADNQQIDGYQYFKVIDNGVPTYVVTVKGSDEIAYQVGQITSLQLETLVTAYKEKYNKSNFIKNLLLDNLLLVDTYSRARKLDIDKDTKRVIFLIQAKKGEVFENTNIIRDIFPEQDKDFITPVDEESFVLLKELTSIESDNDIYAMANIIYENLINDVNDNVYVSIGTIITDIKNVSVSYKEAKMALEVNKIFKPAQKIIDYKKLGIGRLLYQLPTTLCNLFIQEVLNDLRVEQLDHEILSTIDKFFENHLNVSETSRQLYIHRNTLVYRLDKLQKLTGLDLRKFDDAIVFKITLMVSKYMEYRETFNIKKSQL